MSTPGTGSGQPPESGPEAGRQPVRIPRRDTDVGRVIDAPTEGVERDELPKNLPDLDKIHQVAPAAAPTVPVPAQPAADAPAAPVAPTEPAGPAAPAGEAAPSNLHTVGGAPARAAGVKTQAAGGGPVRAGMQLRSIDPWTTFKLTGVVSVVLFFVWMIAVGVLYIVLSGMGVWSKINDSFQTLTNEQAGVSLLTAGNVFTYAGLAGLANVILLTALATVGAFIYNLCADLVGGIEVTLSDRD
ncbi:Transmembrane domain of uncharacterised function (DUF3566) (plasmid) [Tsukamurella tyrosinosolvens]|uniref:DUF3566 domain-containing protein n=1 Tax=Tsukamurella tyrosinosolvens TaxID=57704 RepID=A0A1H4IEI7_TSUTY|nr:DUF3566 domain-containing protein [Tsukamurella tyrosinosolvens]KXO98137.1 hypothetical protein AXK58_25990 [Tsukamurella tyrosinosolvens]SEB32086.1 Transmembrane protein of unknown function [Tsukamurella tyrosinosolvens]VEH94856.1 Transmembrane domain of uncharacterised function (DUF3566) [Tsukamurella tyrosinosolvens]